MTHKFNPVKYAERKEARKSVQTNHGGNNTKERLDVVEKALGLSK